MNKTKIAKLKAAGFAVGNAQDFLELTPEESAYVELRLSLAKQAGRGEASPRGLFHNLHGDFFNKNDGPSWRLRRYPMNRIEKTCRPAKAG